MLKSITFLKDFRCFKKNDHFTFQNLTLLVGDQGCGKSTILELLSQKIPNVKEIVSLETTNNQPVKTISFDFEKDNVRIGQNNFTKAMDIVGATGALALKYASHGQVIQAITSTINTTTKTLILMDEPDMALSIRSCIKLSKMMNESAKSNQIIVSVHNPILIQNVHNVLSLEHKKWMFSKEFERFHRET